MNEKKKQKKVCTRDGWFFLTTPDVDFSSLLAHIFGLFSYELTERNKPIYRAIVFPHNLSLSRTRTHINDIYITQCDSEEDVYFLHSKLREGFKFEQRVFVFVLFVFKVEENFEQKSWRRRRRKRKIRVVVLE